MRTRRVFSEGESLGFDLSISDLMSALCGIFVLIMITVVVQLNMTKAEYASKNKKAESYYSMQNDLYNDLNNEFKDDLVKWNAEITPDLTIRFKDTEVFFDPDKWDIKPYLQMILDDFFPRLTVILENPKYKDEIEEIRIEGHTARDKKKDLYTDYKEGMTLSQARTREVMIHCLGTLNDGDKDWVQEYIAAIGYSLSRPVYEEEGEINWDRSRRVEFKIKTKAEKVIEEMADEGFKAEHE